MLRMIKKLVLRRDTVRTLSNTDLAVVDAGTGANGGDTTCVAHTREASGCAIVRGDVTESPRDK